VTALRFPRLWPHIGTFADAGPPAVADAWSRPPAEGGLLARSRRGTLPPRGSLAQSAIILVNRTASFGAAAF
jgi:hypothetical protein